MTVVERTLAHEVHRQDTGYFCGPASVRTLLSIRKVVVAENVLAAEMGTTSNGTDRQPIAAALNRWLGGDLYASVAIPGRGATGAEREALTTALTKSIDAGYGIIANVVGDAVDTQGDRHNYTGHYIAVVGYRRGSTDLAWVSDVAIGRDYWMTIARLADWCAMRGYVHAARAIERGEMATWLDDTVLAKGGRPWSAREVLVALETRSDWLVNRSDGLAAKLGAILAAAQDDGDVSVQLGPEAMAELAKVRDELAAIASALPGATADAVADELAARVAD